ncbi:hypothetical protein [Actinoplanes sp. NPDC049802]|uniref:hypothetical protein n=1 Tax=Actinoplanes sp. NPDC049802 TaxID=3154742 RepID=UPI0033F314FA
MTISGMVGDCGRPPAKNVYEQACHDLLPGELFRRIISLGTEDLQLVAVGETENGEARLLVVDRQPCHVSEEVPHLLVGIRLHADP